MARHLRFAWFAATLAFALSSQAQIRYVTVPTLKVPFPPMFLFPSPATPTVANTPTVAASRVSRPVVPFKPSLDKAELEQHVVAFQKQRALEGSESAQYELGIRYLSGEGVEKDPKAARYWLKLSAQGGNRQARVKLQELSASSSLH
jgi:TPR repeat protein